MALSKKAKFQLEVQETFGVFPLFEGRAPAYLDSKKIDGERFGPWCRRVLEREPDDVSILSTTWPDPRHAVRNLSKAGVAEGLQAICQEQRELGRASRVGKLEMEVAVAQRDKEDLKRQLKRVQDSKSQIASRMTDLETAAAKRSRLAKASSQTKAGELLGTALLEFVAEEADRLHTLVVANGRAAALHISATGDVNAGLWMLFAFMDRRVRMANGPETTVS